LFIAADVGDAVRDEVARVSHLINEALATAKTPPRVTWLSRGAVHLTLCFLGEVAEGDVPGLQRRLADPIDVTPFDVEWHGLGAFPSLRHPRTLWIGVSRGAHELGRLESALSRRLGRVAIEAGPFRPHLTLGRVRTPGNGVNWDDIFRDVAVRGVRSRVARVTLYRSTLSPRGPNYTEMAHAALHSTGDRAPSAEGDR
jgi:RNA 2',3'-cyclic 3'-phosphodiesterase